MISGLDDKVDCLVHQNAIGENFTDDPGKSDKYTGKLMCNSSNLKIAVAYQKTTKTQQNHPKPQTTNKKEKKPQTNKTRKTGKKLVKDYKFA